MLGGRRWSRAVEARRNADRTKVLARAVTRDGRLLSGTRHALLVSRADEVENRWSWAEVAGASWSASESTLVLRLVDAHPVRGLLGQTVEHRFGLDDAERLLDLVRERVQASVLLRRTSPLLGGGEAVLALRRDEVAGGAGSYRWALDLPSGTVLTDGDREDLHRLALAVVEELGLAGQVSPPALRNE